MNSLVLSGPDPLALPGYGYILAGLVGSGRMLGFVALFPVFTFTNITGILRVIIAVGLALPIMTGQMPALASELAARPDLGALLAAKEVLLGALFGVIAGMPVWAATTAGDIIDNFRGASSANFTDPVNALELTVFGQAYEVFATAWIAVSGALSLSLEAVYQSFGAWPLRETFPEMRGELVHIAAEAVTHLAESGLIMAAPLLTFMLLVEAGLLFISSTAKQLQVYDLAMTFKNLTMILLLPVYAFFIVVYLKSGFNSNYELIFAWMRLTGGGGDGGR